VKAGIKKYRFNCCVFLYIGNIEGLKKELNALAINNFKLETYIKTNVEAPRSPTNPISCILINISGPATHEVIRTAKKYQMPFDVIFLIQSNTKIPLKS
jgi:hypothetical protein